MKKLNKKKAAFVLGGVIVLSALIGSCGDDEATQPATTEPKQEVVQKEEPKKETPKEEVKKEEPKQEVKKEEPKPEPKKEESKELSQSQKEQAMLSIIKTSFDGIADVKFDKDSKAYTIFPTEDGFIQAIALMQSGAMSKDTWYGLVDSTKQTSSNMSKQLGSGYTLNILNPANKDNVILMVMDGVVIYDAFQG